MITVSAERRSGADRRTPVTDNLVVNKIQFLNQTVKTLSGLLSICAYCKKVRDDKGHWSQIESYISNYAETKFSHGFCPECSKKLYTEHEIGG